MFQEIKLIFTSRIGFETRYVVITKNLVIPIPTPIPAEVIPTPTPIPLIVIPLEVIPTPTPLEIFYS